MIYNNLLYFLAAILIFSTSSIPETPQFTWPLTLAIFLAKALLYYQLCARGHGEERIETDSDYFAADQKFSVLAVFFFALDVYVLDAKYFLARLPLATSLPVIVNIGGLGLFFFYLCLLWLAARRDYHAIFDLPAHRAYSRRGFLLYHVKTNLPIVLPWLFISLLFDLLQLIPLPAFKRLAASQWAEPVVMLFFFVFLATTLPGLVKRLWDCRELAAGPLRSHIEEFCRRQGFSAQVLLWPLFEGRVLTAAVMGISKRFRYLLLTPALLSALNAAELDAVLAHEIGHAKKYHLQLYLLLFLGFGLLLSLIANPLLYLLLNTSFFYKLMHWSRSDVASALAFWGTIPLVVSMLVYFRYIFGFFMRNFERQADLHVFAAIGKADSLISSFEKIGALTGRRDQPSWHHFGIGERIEFLQRCEANRAVIKRHNLKVYVSLALYVLVLAGSAGLIQSLPADFYKQHDDSGLAGAMLREALIKQRIRQEPGNAFWWRLLGDFQQERRLDAEAIAAYSKGLSLEPADAEIMNNLAWVLLMSGNARLRDPVKALSLATAAAARRPAGFILDTLATAHWANGDPQAAVAAENEAMARDPANRGFYATQIEKFLQKSY